MTPPIVSDLPIVCNICSNPCLKEVNAEEHLGLAYDYVLRNCCIKGDVLDSEEYSDAVLGLMQAVDTFNHKNEFSTYAAVCIRNAVVQGFRARKRFPEVYSEIEIQEDDTTYLFEDEDEMSWVLEAEFEKSYEQLDRQMMLEHYLERLSMKTIGRKYGVTKGRVSQRIARAIYSLKLKTRAKKHAGF